MAKNINITVDDKNVTVNPDGIVIDLIDNEEVVATRAFAWEELFSCTSLVECVEPLKKAG